MNENQQEKLVLVDGEIMPEAEAFIDVNDRAIISVTVFLKLYRFIMAAASLCCRT